MAKILVAFDTVNEGFEKIGAEHEVIRPPHGRDFTHEELCQLLPEADVLCTSFDYPAHAELLQHGSKLRLIAIILVRCREVNTPTKVRNKQDIRAFCARGKCHSRELKSAFS